MKRIFVVKNILQFMAFLLQYLGLLGLGALLTGAGHGSDLFTRVALMPFGLNDAGWPIVEGIVFWSALFALIQKRATIRWTYVTAMVLLSIHYGSVVILLTTSSEEMFYANQMLNRQIGAAWLFIGWYVAMQILIVATLAINAKKTKAI